MQKSSKFAVLSTSENEIQFAVAVRGHPEAAHHGRVTVQSEVSNNHSSRPSDEHRCGLGVWSDTDRFGCWRWQRRG